MNDKLKRTGKVLSPFKHTKCVLQVDLVIALKVTGVDTNTNNCMKRNLTDGLSSDF